MLICWFAYVLSQEEIFLTKFNTIFMWTITTKIANRYRWLKIVLGLRMEYWPKYLMQYTTSFKALNPSLKSLFMCGCKNRICMQLQISIYFTMFRVHMRHVALSNLLPLPILDLPITLYVGVHIWICQLQFAYTRIWIECIYRLKIKLNLRCLGFSTQTLRSPAELISFPAEYSNC